jgi:hypothetical protein
MQTYYARLLAWSIVAPLLPLLPGFAVLSQAILSVQQDIPKNKSPRFAGENNDAWAALADGLGVIRR